MTKENREKLIKKLIKQFKKKQTIFTLTNSYDVIVDDEEMTWRLNFDKRIIKNIDDKHIDSLLYGI